MLADNSVKVVRIDNNKVVLDTQNLDFSIKSSLSNTGKSLVVAVGTKL
jgi:hypothetical protein